jgi:hypothetical protein
VYAATAEKYSQINPLIFVAFAYMMSKYYFAMNIRSRDTILVAMPRTHPHADATYRVFPVKDGAFGIEVIVPGTNPAVVTPFVNEAAADTWVVNHKARIEADPSLYPRGRGFRIRRAK